MKNYYAYCPVCGNIEIYEIEKISSLQAIKLQCCFCDSEMIFYTDLTADELMAISETQINQEIEHNQELKLKLSSEVGAYGSYLFNKQDQYFANLIGLYENPEFNPELHKKVLAYDNDELDNESFYMITTKYKNNHERFESIQKKLCNQKNNSEVSPVTQQQPNQKVCPKCGGTNFTPVRKNWSFLTGILTNKVELVCNQCGYKIK